MDDSLGNASKRSTKVGRKGIKTRSDVWDHFDRSDTPSGWIATCNYCGKIYTAENGTSQSRRHLQSKHPDKYPCSSDTNSVDNFYDQESSRKLLVQLITCGGMPLHFVENQFFLKWVHSLQPMYIPDKIENLKIHVLEYFTNKKLRLKLKLRKATHIHLTFHTWDSRQYKYLAITAHHIDDSFELKNVMIGFKQLPLDYTPIHLKSVVEKCFNDWRIDKNILSCTSSTKMRRNLTSALHPLLNKVLFFQCCSDVINGMVRHCLSAISKNIESIRRIVRSLYIRSNNKESHNQGARDKHNSLVNSIPLDDISRWDSTLQMLRAAFSYKNELDYYARNHLFKEYPDFAMLSADDWRRVSSVVKYLETFYNAMNVFSNCRDKPANLYLKTFHEILDVLCDKNNSCDETLNKLSIDMQVDFRDYLSHNYRLLSVASVLDPSRKIYSVQFFCNEFFEKDSNDKIVGFTRLLQNFFKIYLSRANKNHTAYMEHENYNTEEANIGNSGKKNLEHRFSQFKRQRMNNATLSELDTYLQEPAVDGNENSTVPYWWKDNSYRYPVLSRMAKDFLAVKISALPLEYAFCMDGQLIDYVNDATTNPDLVEAMVCCKHWEKSSFDDNSGALCFSNSSGLIVE